uniref:Fatty acid desaturase putative n=1 Tax=Albugo laibachii Nc14 TaxID=890382 RepID=F0WLH7_9STRA|nr:fatty acid desaturase putative [Albugo laibachii Nc14]|eukprot:CCA22140.1 fatty acid desaturase putative [Albugo laibachii Nc14]
MAIPKSDKDICDNKTILDQISSDKFANEQHHEKRALAEAGYTHLEGCLNPTPLNPPPFTIKDIRAAIPPHCFERSLALSSYHLAKNLLICGGLYCGATYIDQLPILLLRWALWAMYWFFQGSYMTGIWVIAHECGHQAFSDSTIINNTVGLMTHSALLVPYHSWRITHRQHHSNAGSCENDSIYIPASKSIHASSCFSEALEHSSVYNLYKMTVMLTLGWMPGYLFFNASGPKKYYGKARSHFNPLAVMFNDRERYLIVLSDVGVAVMLLLLGWYSMSNSFGSLISYYGIPFYIVNVYLVAITYLQHTDIYIPRYRDDEWTWLRGALATVDRSFGAYLNGVLHHITDTHVVHHLFSSMPFYHAQEATEAVKPVLGKYYLNDPTNPVVAIWRSFRYCRYVDDDRKTVFYQRKL